MHQGKKKTKPKFSKSSRPSAMPETLEPRYLLSGGDWGGPHPDFSPNHGGGNHGGDIIAPLEMAPAPMLA